MKRAALYARVSTLDQPRRTNCSICASWPSKLPSPAKRPTVAVGGLADWCSAFFSYRPALQRAGQP